MKRLDINHPCTITFEDDGTVKFELAPVPVRDVETDPAVAKASTQLDRLNSLQIFSGDSNGWVRVGGPNDAGAPTFGSAEALLRWLWTGRVES